MAGRRELLYIQVASEEAKGRYWKGYFKTRNRKQGLDLNTATVSAGATAAMRAPRCGGSVEGAWNGPLVTKNFAESSDMIPNDGFLLTSAGRKAV